MFVLGWAFARQIEVGIREVQHYLVVVVGSALVVWFLVRYVRARRRGGKPVGPPVLEEDEVPLPPGDVTSEGPSPVPSPRAEDEARKVIFPPSDAPAILPDSIADPRESGAVIPAVPGEESRASQISPEPGHSSDHLSEVDRRN
jgi:hypothetical protein